MTATRQGGGYDDSPSKAHTPLTADELADLLAGDGTDLARSPRKIRHLLTRIEAAFTRFDDDLRGLKKDVEKMRGSAKRAASPIASAMDALHNLNREQQRQVYDLRGQQMLDEIDAARSDAARILAAARSETNRARLVLAQVAEHPGVPTDAKTLLAEHIRKLPAEAGVVAQVGGTTEPMPRQQGEFSIRAASELGGELFG